MPTELQYLLLRDASRDLAIELRDNGPIALSENPPVVLRRPSVTSSSFLETMFNESQVRAALTAVQGSVALAYSYNPEVVPQDRARETLTHTHLAFQLVKPTPLFAEYWLRVDDAGRIASSSKDLAWIHINRPLPCLWYQQHHQIIHDDVEAVKRLLPKLFLAFAPTTVSGSWGHPCGPVHRALVMFAEGYLTEMFSELRPFLWAMGLDCLFASRLNRKRQGSAAIGQRLQKLFGPAFEPYNTVSIPVHQNRPAHKLRNVVKDIFTFRNACAHGLPIPDAWLTPAGCQIWEGYAYQICECTEILLRQTLLRILNDQQMFDVFVDSAKLDVYFG